MDFGESKKSIQDLFESDNKLHVLITNDSNSIARIEYSFSENPLIESKMNINFFNQNLVASSLFGIHKEISSNISEFRLLQINKEKETIKSIINTDLRLFELKNPMRIEIIPDDQRNLATNEFLIRCRKVSIIDDKFHSQKPISLPFLFKVIENEPFRQTRERIEKYIDEKNRYKVRYNLSDKDLPERQLTNDDVISDMASETSQITIIFNNQNAHKGGDFEGLTIF